MKKNLGLLDKIIRSAAAVVVLVLYLAGLISGTAAILLGVIAVVLAATSLVSFCPIYAVLKISTNKPAVKQ
ncbi:MAG: DUF2892 domain-containing protein [Ignavibacteriae bacterium]|nr:MAG: DUF2892 domain-containing protein [Ignavibacteriota bacterium]